MMMLAYRLVLICSCASGFDFTRSPLHHLRRPIPSVHPYLAKGYGAAPARIQTSLTAFRQSDDLQSKHITFVSPLLEDGYPPAVKDYNQRSKPLLLYLPGFDGTILAPFIQFPSLGESFDVRAMKVGMDNRSAFDELKSIVLFYVSLQSKEHEGVFLMGESFGGILAIEVSRDIQSLPEYANVQLKGLTLINPATSYLRSALYQLGPPIANQSSFLPPLTFLQYVYSLTSQLVPLFLDEGLAFQQLMLILSSKGLPAVLNTPEREAYMGRVAFDLVNRLKFMPQDTLKWRLERWLECGCTLFENQLEVMQQKSEGREALESLKSLKALIVVGEFDITLPSVEEAERLASTLFYNARVHVVEGAGHASTCGSSVILIQLMREFFSDLKDNVADTKRYAQPNNTELLGLVPRYDNAVIGMSPLLYWHEEYYQQIIE